MNVLRNNILKIAVVLAVVFGVSSCATPHKKSVDKKIKQPNIIYILADDAGWGDFSCYGQEKFSTPNIDALAESGIRFTDHYAGSSVCAPSRSALLTGQHTGHTPIRGNKEVLPEGQVPIPADTYSLPKMLKQEGYVTGMFGKWGLGYPQSEGAPNAQGFDEFYGYNCQRLAHTYYPLYLRHNGTKVPLPANSEGQMTYTHDMIHEQALSFIDQNKDKPFFMYLPYTIPHAEMVVPQDSLFQAYKEKFPQGKPYVNKANHDPNLTHEDRFYRGAYGDQEYPRAAFATMMHYLDQSVGEVVQKVKDLGLEENTIIIFSSDNGPHKEGGADPYYFKSFGPFKGVKRDLYEGGIRVPMIVSWPKTIAEKTVSDHPSAFWDVLPTVAEIVGVEIAEDKNIDGISFLPTLLGESKNQAQHDYLYWEFHEKGGRRAVRMGDWKAVQYNLKKKKKIEIYNLSDDPSESNNLAKEQPEVVKRAQKIFDEARTVSRAFPFQAESL
ncbi:arylsulfatase [Flammeovirga sp. EKP202]|uniref:arylsulfatase n=1 Tax=Flammeovirga sp. EKP202 TaxID=2770592 RepID=UPI001660017D|nr:arylsulfatase [Flammeovirga sp. EKP202]MBD0402835.1 arylsulfatase [Flammeovirga sp. EKP202]